MKRTISNLSRETKVSRQTIYKKIKELGTPYDKKEFTELDYESLKKELSGISNINKSKVVLPVIESCIESTRLSDGEQSTLRDRLKKAKDQYNFNDTLICQFQAEANEYFAEHKKTTILTHNRTEAPIPAIVSIEKYIKLNVTLSKLISGLEAELDLTDDEEDDAFG